MPAAFKSLIHLLTQFIVFNRYLVGRSDRSLGPSQALRYAYLPVRSTSAQHLWVVRMKSR